jgi:hypothetical protein
VNVPSSSDSTHPANVFARAFLKAQAITASRTRWEDDWPLISFWKDDLIKEMKTVFEFIDPIVLKALETKKRGMGKTFDMDEDATLLDQLVQQTDGTTIYRPCYLEFC